MQAPSLLFLLWSTDQEANKAHPGIIVRRNMLSIRQHNREDRAQCGVYGCEHFCAAEYPCWATLGHKDTPGGQLGLDNIPVEILCIKLHHKLKSTCQHLSERHVVGGGRGGGVGQGVGSFASKLTAREGCACRKGWKIQMRNDHPETFKSLRPCTQSSPCVLAEKR